MNECFNVSIKSSILEDYTWTSIEDFSNPEIIKENSPKKSSFEVGAQQMKNSYTYINQILADFWK